MRHFSSLVVVALLYSTPASAQTPTTSSSTRTPPVSTPSEEPMGSQHASAGWNLERADPSQGTAPFGVTTDFSRKVMSLSGDGCLVGEFSFSHFTGASVMTFMGGFRAAERIAPKVKVFGQFLAGALHVFGETDFAVQPGGGVDVAVNPRFDLRIRLDFPIDFFDGGHQTGKRFGVGIVIPVGTP
jgi:hypothetical protein